MKICIFSLLAQPGIKITGTVSDDAGGLMPGVAVVVRGSTQGTTTDINGEFTLTVPTDTSVLQFRFIGYRTQEILVGNRKIIAVSLQEAPAELGEVVVVAFGTQKKESVISSVTTIAPAELKVPSSNLTTALAGRIAGVIAYQQSGEPGQDNAEFFVRGVTTFGYAASPLILIDGVEMSSSDLARLQVDDIANFSIMKDATATALYGARGANGVILVTTKEGKEGKVSFSVRYETSISSPTRNVEMADPVTYMQLHNEAVTTRNPLNIQPYMPEKIDNTIAGTNPYVYPAVDWYKMLFKDQTVNQRVNFNVSGGGTIARYYVAATYTDDKGVLNVDGRNNFNNNINLKRYLIHSNININLTRSTEAIIRLHTTFDNYTGPIDGGTALYNRIMRTNPVLFPPYFPSDEAYPFPANRILFGNAGTTGTYINPYADMVRGYKDYNAATVLAQFELKQSLDFILKGLKIRALYNETRNTYSDVSRGYTPFYYAVGSYDKYADTYTLTELNQTSGTDYLNYSEGPKTVESTRYTEVAVNYDQVFGEKHTVSGILVGIRRNKVLSNAGSVQLSLPYRNIGVSGRATYSYASRYFLEANFGYNGSERFDLGHRFGFFPSFGIGYLVSNEQFYGEQLKKIMPTLKFKATYGLVGNDNIGSPESRFYFLSQVNMNAGVTRSFGTDFSHTANRIIIERYANPNITWEVAKKVNLGLEINLLNAIDINVDFFKESRGNILMNRSYIPMTMGIIAAEGAKIPQANLGEAEGQGVDFSIDYKKSFDTEWWLIGRINFTYASSKFTKYEEPDYSATPWLSYVGQKLSQQWGYVAERLFVDDDEVENSPYQGSALIMAGDIKYRDINDDGQISTIDQVPIGYPSTPEIIYGFGLSAGWKWFDLSCFFQGLARKSFFIRTTSASNQYSTMPFQNQTQLLKAYADDHWSEYSRNLYALYPRFDSEENVNNRLQSTWWMRNGSFLRLKSAELGYTMPARLTEKIRLEKVRIYASGTNLLTFSKFKLWDVEMGGNGLGYPIQKVINAGIQVSF
jgi:TonB-linked SusC/RagA family outer membrane protein